ncbi:MAG TPA: IucA/IucC family protein, partial [Catenuloplanes sp.]
MSQLAADRGRHRHRQGHTLPGAVAHAEAGLDAHAPALLAGFRRALPVATDTVNRRLLGALVREQLTGAPATRARPARRHGFGRVEFDDVPAAEPADLLPTDLDPAAAGSLAVELNNAVVNLAVAMARGPATGTDAGRTHRHTGTAPTNPDAGYTDPDAGALAAERLAVTGHNLHPCGRTRLGWEIPDVLAHDLEAGHTGIGFVAVRADLHLGDDVMASALGRAYPDLPTAPAGYRLQPVHRWQRDTVLARYADLVHDGRLRRVDGELPAEPTAALRTLLLPPGRDGVRHYLKVSLDIQVTSTRRGISVAATRNGPILSALLHRLLADDPDGAAVLLMAEPAGAAVPAGSGRDLSVIVRTALTGRLDAREIAVPGGALPAIDPATGGTVVAGLVGAYARSHARRDDAAAALAFLSAYARLLLPPLLRLATGYGVALEAHLQNCLPTF